MLRPLVERAAVGWGLVTFLLHQLELLPTMTPRYCALAIGLRFPSCPLEQQRAVLQKDRMQAAKIGSCRCHRAELVQGRMEVVGGRLQIHRIAAKVRATMPHVVAPAGAAATDKVEDAACHRAWVAGWRVTTSPDAVPGGVELRPQQGRARMRLAHGGDSLRRDGEAV